MVMPDYALFEERIGVVFNERRLLMQAFTHRSYLNENKTFGEHNERLEFLGDAVLELIVTEFLYREYKSANEGQMTSYRSALVNYVTLAQVASELGMNEFLLLSYGESKDTGRARQVILANAFEALVGALYLDGGYDTAKEFVSVQLLPRTADIVKGGRWADAKSMFQEKAQDRVGITPSYVIVKEQGPDHDKCFTVAVKLGVESVAEGKGKSKQEAEQDAARAGLAKKKWT
jgi:ribonuclease III